MCLFFSVLTKDGLVSGAMTSVPRAGGRRTKYLVSPRLVRKQVEEAND